MNSKNRQTSLVEPNQLTPTEIEILVEEGKLLRVLQPELARQIKQILEEPDNEAHDYVVERNGQLYLSISEINDEAERKKIYDLVQQCQLDVPVDLSGLPIPLLKLIRPETVFTRRFLYALLGGGLLGIIIGVLAMALSIQVMAAAELAMGAPMDAFGDLQITAVTFVIFSVLGWMLATLFLWRRFKR